VAAGSLVAGRANVSPAADQPTAAARIAGKDARLIVHVAEPPEFETPLALLRESRITPTALLFVRTNQPMAGAETLAPRSADGWKIEIAGLRDGPAEIALAEIAALPQVDVEMVLQCSGNGRAFLSDVAPAKGAQWRAGAMGNVRFRGVPLKQAFEHFKIKLKEPARFLTAEGRDAPAKSGDPDFEHSIPLDDALARSMLALQLNGEPLPAAHGGPVRLVTPGYYATMNVKWLSRLRFEAAETANYHQVGRYRTPKEPLKPGDKFTSDLTNSDANWRMRVKSVIFAPLDGEQLAAGKTNVRGVAFGDGAKIETVLVATSPEGPWQAAKIEPSDSPYAWQHWSVEIELPRGKQQLIARATDVQGRSQPLSAAADWNPAGYGYHAAHAVHVLVE
jgi:DMSO/TMAO reductase YedYZ molybdopterin-dependent catalytic subunit